MIVCRSQCEGRQPPAGKVHYSLRWEFNDPNELPGKLEVAEGNFIRIQPLGKAMIGGVLTSFTRTAGTSTPVGTMNYKKEDGSSGRVRPARLVPALILPELHARGQAFSTTTASETEAPQQRGQQQQEAGNSLSTDGQQQQGQKRKQQHQEVATKTRRWQAAFARAASKTGHVQWDDVRAEDIKGQPFKVKKVCAKPGFKGNHMQVNSSLTMTCATLQLAHMGLHANQGKRPRVGKCALEPQFSYEEYPSSYLVLWQGTFL